MDINDIYRAIRPLKNRMHVKNALRCMIAAMAAAGGVSFIIACIALFTPVLFLSDIIIKIYATAFVTGIAASLFLRPGNLKTMKTADLLGLKERLITSYELKDDYSPIARIQRYDAVKSISNVNFKSLYSIVPAKTEVFIALSLLCITLLLLFIPSVSKDKAAIEERVLTEIRKQAAKFEEEKKELSKRSDLSDAKLKEIDKNISELLEELKKSKNEGEALKALSRAKHELEKLKNKELDEEMMKLAERLQENPITKDFGDALKNGNMDDLKQKIEKMNEMLKGLDDEEKKKLADDLRKFAEEISENSELVQDILDISEAVEKGGLNAIKNEMEALGETFNRLAKSNENLADAMKQLENQVISNAMNSIDNARRRIAGQAGGGSLLAQQEGQNERESEAGSEGSGQNQGDGQGQGGGNGQGQGEGGGGGGSGQGQGEGGGGGAGDGTTGKDSGYGGEESGGGSRRPGGMQVKEYEEIYVPDRLGDGGDISYVKGNRNTKGESALSEASNIPVEKGYTVPYNEVLEEYRNEAVNRISNAPIPPVMKDIVRDYFTELEY